MFLIFIISVLLNLTKDTIRFSLCANGHNADFGVLCIPAPFGVHYVSYRFRIWEFGNVLLL